MNPNNNKEGFWDNHGIWVRSATLKELQFRKLHWGKRTLDAVIWDMIKVTPSNKEKMDKIEKFFEWGMTEMEKSKIKRKG